MKSMASNLLSTGGYDEDSLPSSSVMSLNLASMTYRSLARMPGGGRAEHATVILEGKCYVIGGFGWSKKARGKDVLASVECFDLATGTWSKIAAMSTARLNPAAAALEGKLYVTGGSDGTQALSSGECWDPGTGQWTAVAPMNTARSNHGMVTVKDKLFVVGGNPRPWAYLKSVEYLEPTTGIWTTTAPLNEARDAPGVVVLEEAPTRIFVIGGTSEAGATKSAEFLRLDKSGPFKIVAPMATARHNVATVAIAGGKVVAIGGETSSGYSRSIESFDPKYGRKGKGRWKTVPGCSGFVRCSRVALCTNMPQMKVQVSPAKPANAQAQQEEQPPDEEASEEGGPIPA